MKLPSKWHFYKSEFDYHKGFDDAIEAWAGHIFFSYDLLRNLQPQTIVELGTYKGTSLYSYCQAIKDGKLDTKVFAVDCWEGDDQTGFYGGEIYQHVQKMLAEFYPEVKVELMKMYFDEALPKFEDSSIDVLHIDGLHTYEAVKHDYDTWKTKVKPDGVIMFHDTMVTELEIFGKKEQYGVGQLWEELKAENPQATFINFEHNFGLGVIFKDPEAAQVLDSEFLGLMLEYYGAKGTGMVNRRQLETTKKQLDEVQKDKLALIREVERVTAIANENWNALQNAHIALNRRGVKLAIKASDEIKKLSKRNRQKP